MSRIFRSEPLPELLADNSRELEAPPKFRLAETLNTRINNTCMSRAIANQVVTDHGDCETKEFRVYLSSSFISSVSSSILRADRAIRGRKELISTIDDEACC